MGETHKVFWLLHSLLSDIVLLASGAARGGHLRVLNWLLTNPVASSYCDKNDNVCENAARSGHLGVTKIIDNIATLYLSLTHICASCTRTTRACICYITCKHARTRTLKHHMGMHTQLSYEKEATYYTLLKMLFF